LMEGAALAPKAVLMAKASMMDARERSAIESLPERVVDLGDPILLPVPCRRNSSEGLVPR
jgi:hypothetical protein